MNFDWENQGNLEPSINKTKFIMSQNLPIQISLSRSLEFTLNGDLIVGKNLSHYDE